MNVNAYYTSRQLHTLESDRKDWIAQMLALNPQDLNTSGKPVLHVYYWFDLYPDDPKHMACLKDLESSTEFEIAYILHDHDTYNNLASHRDLADIYKQVQAVAQEYFSDWEDLKPEDCYINIPKKNHYHVILKRHVKCTNASLLKTLSYYKPTIGKDLVVRDPNEAVAYLVHKTTRAIAEGKYQYDWTDIVHSCDFEDLIDRATKQYNHADVSPVPELLDAIDYFTKSTLDPNQVYMLIAQSKFSYMLTGSNFNMLRTFVDNSIRKNGSIKKYAEMDLKVYNRTFNRYLDAICKSLSRELVHAVSHTFTSSDIHNICTKFNHAGFTHSDTCVCISEAIVEVFAKTCKPNSIETIEVMFDRIDKTVDNFDKTIKLHMGLLCSYLVNAKRGLDLYDTVLKYFKSETNFI